MKKKCFAMLCALTLALVIPLLSLADRMYIIPDSNTRRLTESELWDWDYESLGYIMNEIFARHGYVFEAGGRYEDYFTSMPWYTPNSDSDNSRACYPKLNEVEWYNERLVKEVRQDMRALGLTNSGGKSLWTSYSSGFDTLSDFTYCQLKTGQKLPVYSAPGSYSWRGGNGKAAMSTNGAVYAAGWEDGWLLVMYETNNGGVRVGYVDGSQIKGNVPVNVLLNYSPVPAVIDTDCSLTDDPAAYGTTMRKLSAGTEVTFLTNMFNQDAWAYIETTVNGKLARGFVPAEYVSADISDAAYTEDYDDETIETLVYEYEPVETTEYEYTTTETTEEDILTETTEYEYNSTETTEYEEVTTEAAAQEANDAAEAEEDAAQEADDAAEAEEDAAQEANDAAEAEEDAAEEADDAAEAEEDAAQEANDAAEAEEDAAEAEDDDMLETVDGKKQTKHV